MATEGLVLDLSSGQVRTGLVDPSDRYTGELLPNGNVRCFGREYKFTDSLEELKKYVPQQDIVLDCGASSGGFAKRCFAAFPDAEIHSFEPVDALYKELDVYSLAQLKHHAYNLALLDASGTRTIHLTKGPQSNSFLGFLPGNPLAEPHEVIGEEVVSCTTLDDWCTANLDDLDRVTLLKLDVQGSELFALRGALKLLPHVKAIYVEVAFIPIYEFCPLAEHVDAFLETAGFHRAVLFGSPRPDIWANALYVRRDILDSLKTTAVRLNIGSGTKHLDGYVDIDRKLGSEAFPLAYPDESADEIRASHVLEHFSFRDSLDVLKDWTRVLKPGGRMRLAVPDFDRIIGLSRLDPKWQFYLMGGQSDENDFHKSVWTIDALRGAMKHVGLSDVRLWESTDGDCSELPCSLNLEGVKNGKASVAATTQTIRISACMSIPRVGWNDNWGHTMEALSPFRIPIRRFNGVYWGQCMHRAFNDCLADGIDWILTIDYDTLFTSKHLDRLMEHFAKRPDIDAIAALQARRGSAYPLMTIGGEKDCLLSTDPVKVTTAHFGLTLIRTDSLREVAKPWFFTKPDDDSEYGDNRMDDDIWFWHQWRLAGKTIYIATDVSIGHLEPMVAEFDLATGQHRHTYIQDWREANVPAMNRKPKCLSDSKATGGNGAVESSPTSTAESQTS